MKLTVLSGSDSPDAFIVECDRLWAVRFEPIAGELGRFHAVSETRFQCASPCGNRFSRSVKKQAELGEGCPRCGEFADKVRYLVDVIQPHGNPQCTCESYTTTRGKPCKHCHAALYLFGKLMAAAMAEKQ